MEEIVCSQKQLRLFLKKLFVLGDVRTSVGQLPQVSEVVNLVTHPSRLSPGLLVPACLAAAWCQDRQPGISGPAFRVGSLSKPLALPESVPESEIEALVWAHLPLCC